MEQIGSIFRDANNQSTNYAGKVKTSAAARGSLICGVAGLLILGLLIFTLLDYFPSDIGNILRGVFVLISSALGIIGLILGIIGLILGTIGLIQIKALPWKLKGSGVSIAGLVISASVIALLLFPITGPPGPRYSIDRIAKIQISEFDQAIQLFQKDTGRYPTTAEGLDALVHNSGNSDGWNGPYIQKDVPLDPWQRPYHYRYPGSRNPDSCALWSDGADGIEGTKDDITNFK